LITIKLTHAYLGICGPNNVDFIKELGVNEVINYKQTTLQEYINNQPTQKFDVVLDCVGGSSLKEAWIAVKSGGTLLSIVQPVEATKPDEGVSEGVKASFFIVEQDGLQLERITRLIEDGKIRTVVDSVWAFEEFQKAFEKVESGRARGKVVVDVTGDV
jgi:NADPH:quinone reductase-like Zn-dependent oxidoreductase